MTSQPELHVIIGAGPVGQALMHELLARGRRVRIVNRGGQLSAPPAAEVRAGDATDPAAMRALCAGATAVYNCTNAPYTDWPRQFPPLQAGVLAGAAAAGAKLIAIDNLYAYGPTGGALLTEALPPAATTRKGRTRASMAADLLAAHARGEVRVAIGRASDYFGPGARDSAVGARVFVPALAGKPAQLIGPLDLPHTYSYIPDIAHGLATLGENDVALGRIWHLPNAPTVTTREFLGMVFDEAGYPPRIQALPGWLVRGLGLATPMMRELAEMLYEFEEPFVVDHSAFAKAFGTRITPLRDAIRATLAWYRSQAGRVHAASPV